VLRTYTSIAGIDVGMALHGTDAAEGMREGPVREQDAKKPCQGGVELASLPRQLLPPKLVLGLRPLSILYGLGVACCPGSNSSIHSQTSCSPKLPPGLVFHWKIQTEVAAGSTSTPTFVQSWCWSYTHGNSIPTPVTWLLGVLTASGHGWYLGMGMCVGFVGFCSGTS
jgi:hypothetical protein